MMALDKFRLAEALKSPGFSFGLSTKNIIGKNDIKEGVRDGVFNVTRYYS